MCNVWSGSTVPVLAQSSVFRRNMPKCQRGETLPKSVVPFFDKWELGGQYINDHRFGSTHTDELYVRPG